MTKFPLYLSLTMTVNYNYSEIISFMSFFYHKNYFEPFLSAHFLFLEFVNLNLT